MLRNLSIRSKLLTVLAVAVAATALLAMLEVAGEVDARATATRQRRLADVAARAAAAAHELQAERVRAADRLAAGGRQAQGALAAQRRRTDRGVAAYRAATAGLGPTGDAALDHLLTVVGQRLARLPVIRAQNDRRPATSGPLGRGPAVAPGTGPTGPPPRAQAGHDAIVTGLVEVLRALADRVHAPAPPGRTRLLMAVAEAKEATSRERALLATPPAARPAPQAAAVADSARASPSPLGAGAPSREGSRRRQGRSSPIHSPALLPDSPGSQLAALPDPPGVRLVAAAAVARRALDGVRAAAGPRLRAVDAALAAPTIQGARQVELALLEPAGEPDQSSGRRQEAGRNQASNRRQAAKQGQPSDQDQAAALTRLRAGLDARAAVLRQLEQTLTNDLAAVADARLRRQEAWLRERLLFLAVVALVVPVAAFLLLRGAAAPAEAPPAAGGTVAGIARRGQILLERQLRLVQELEREEADPERRLDLARVGQLTARQRRASELLAALAGPGPARRWARAVPLEPLLRAAVADAGAEGPGGRRVDLLTSGEVLVAGPAAADLVHVVAELVDNAVAFSPPAAAVAVTAGRDGPGWLIEVSDRGLGMTDEELAWANQRLAGDPPADPADLAAGDRLGLVVAGRLAARHGIGVRLARSAAGGVTAGVRLPAALLSRPAPAPIQTG